MSTCRSMVSVYKSMVCRAPCTKRCGCVLGAMLAKRGATCQMFICRYLGVRAHPCHEHLPGGRRRPFSRPCIHDNKEHIRWAESLTGSFQGNDQSFTQAQPPSLPRFVLHPPLFKLLSPSPNGLLNLALVMSARPNTCSWKTKTPLTNTRQPVEDGQADRPHTEPHPAVRKTTKPSHF